MEGKIKVKEEVVLSTIGFQNEDYPCSNVETNNYAFGEHRGVGSKMQVKVEDQESGSVYLNNSGTRTGINKGKSNEIDTVINIKEELWMQENTLLEVKRQPKASAASYVQSPNEIVEQMDEDFTVAGSTRLHTEPASNASSTTPSLSTTKDVEEKDDLNPRNSCMELVKDDICEATSSVEKSLNLQNSDQHKQNERLGTFSEKRLHMCDICNRRFSHLQDLENHRLTHVDEDLYKCNICEQRFAYKKLLQMHKSSHKAKQPHRCKMCNKTFSYKKQLKSCILIHEGKLPFRCVVCDKHFSNNHKLRRHMLIHEGTRPHVCPICEKGFEKLASLEVHILNLHRRK